MNPREGPRMGPKRETIANGANLPDDLLLRRAQAGDPEAFGLLFDRHLRALSDHARRWLPGPVRRKVSVLDVVQEARITALDRIVDFEWRGEGSVRNWLLRILKYKAREAVNLHAGTAKRDVGREISRGGRPDTAHVPGRGPSPSEMASAAELAALARRALEALPEHYREVLRLARDERLPLKDVAERIGRSRDATKKLYARALMAFTDEFGRLGGAGA